MLDRTQFVPHSYGVAWQIERHRPRENIRGLVLAGARLLATWIARARQRRALAALDDRLLRDIGISRGEAWRECAKPFWRR
jgi:uncharacterized protein YjiS (DUF1127 family)